jgi:FdhE protein
VNVWQRRSRRAQFLSSSYPACSQILSFYSQLADWQASISAALTGFGQIAGVLPSLFELVRRSGPVTLQQKAEELSREQPQALAAIRRYWDDPPEPSATEFFARSVLQVVASHLPDGMDCPWCRLPPLVGSLKEQGDGKALELACALCLRRRDFPRGRCPECQESSESKLASFTTETYPHIHVRACETCRAYLNVVDTTRDLAAIPEVDDLAALPLDLWAVEQGYHKLQSNIAGV